MKNVRASKMFEFAPDVKIGDVFTRIDRNGKVWAATVVKRTEYFVDVEKKQPYKIWLSDGEKLEQVEAEPTFERCAIHADELSGGYFIALHEVYSKFPQYEKIYKLKTITQEIY